MNAGSQRSRIFVFLGLLLASGTWWGVAPGATENGASQDVAQDKGAPRVFVASPRFDFGSVLEGEDVLHDFIVHNRGNAPLRILSVPST